MNKTQEQMLTEVIAGLLADGVSGEDILSTVQFAISQIEEG
jgi:hypothetical protein